MKTKLLAIILWVVTGLFGQAVPFAGPIQVSNSAGSAGGAAVFSSVTAGSYALTNGATITDPGTGGIALTASGTNQNVTLTPSGTGQVNASFSLNGDGRVAVLNGTAGTASQATVYVGKALSGGQYGFLSHLDASYTTTGRNIANATQLEAGTSGPLVLSSASASNPIQFFLANTEVGRFSPTNGNLLLGTTTDSSNGRLQLATHTTSAGGIGFGTSLSLYSDASTGLTLGGTALNNTLTVSRTTTNPSSVILAAVTSQSYLGFTSDTAGGYTWGRTLVNGTEVLRIYNTGLTTNTPTAGAGLGILGGLVVNSTTASTSTTTGALQVAGGISSQATIWGNSLQSNSAIGGQTLTLKSVSNGATLINLVDAAAANHWQLNCDNSGTFGFQNAASSYALAVTLSDSTLATGKLAVNYTTDATTGGAGSLTTAGGIYAAKQIIGATAILSASATAGIGYATGAGGTVTQLTNRTTGVTLNTVTGKITLFTASGSATPTTFTVTNSTIGADDTVTISQASGTNQYLATVTAITAATSFNITFYSMVGTASDAPVFNYTIHKGAHN